jgi:hypothetical protein
VEIEWSLAQLRRLYAPDWLETSRKLGLARQKTTKLPMVLSYVPCMISVYTNRIQRQSESLQYVPADHFKPFLSTRSKFKCTSLLGDSISMSSASTAAEERYSFATLASTDSAFCTTPWTLLLMLMISRKIRKTLIGSRKPRLPLRVGMWFNLNDAHTSCTLVPVHWRRNCNTQ